MLERLEVRGLGIIDEVSLELEPGFIALTGETGAGKSLLVESLSLLTGQRAQGDLVRTGCERLTVDGWFRPPATAELAELLGELGAPADDGLLVRREVTATGRSRCWVNDVAVNVGALQRLARHLIAIHGQHEQHGLADPAIQRRLVDEYGRLDAPLDSVRAAFAAWRAAAAEAERLRAARDRRRDRLDVIAFQLAEIDSVTPQPGEDEALRQRRALLRHAVRVAELSASALTRLADGDETVLDQLARAERELEGIAECGLDVSAPAQRLREARLLAQEAVRDIQALVEGVGEDPAELERIEGRLHRLEQLTLKYGSPLERVLEHGEALVRERRELEGVEESLGDAERATAAALRTYAVAAHTLEETREQAGAELAAAAEKVLARLNMGGTTLLHRWEVRPEPASPLEWAGQRVAFDADGVRQCELLIAPNPGEEPRPMARIASGGELSRLHLALRTVLRGRGPAAGLSLLFDEVDSGLGGGTASALADLLVDLAALDQVLVVTHLPQVAATAATHVRVSKESADDRTVTRVRRLSPGERIEEVARMISGDRITPSARTHAQALLERR